MNITKEKFNKSLTDNEIEQIMVDLKIADRLRIAHKLWEDMNVKEGSNFETKKVEQILKTILNGDIPLGRN